MAWGQESRLQACSASGMVPHRTGRRKRDALEQGLLHETADSILQVHCSRSSCELHECFDKNFMHRPSSHYRELVQGQKAARCAVEACNRSRRPSSSQHVQCRQEAHCAVDACDGQGHPPCAPNCQQGCCGGHPTPGRCQAGNAQTCTQAENALPK